MVPSHLDPPTFIGPSTFRHLDPFAIMATFLNL